MKTSSGASKDVRSAWRATIQAALTFGPTPIRERAGRAALGALAAALPWSTSVTAILIVVWLLIVIPGLQPSRLRAALSRPEAYVPLVLWMMAVLGMVYAQGATGPERWEGVGSFHRLLVIPILMAQFRDPHEGRWILYAFLISIGALLATSYALAMFPALAWRGPVPGVPVKDYIVQSGFFAFAACIAVQVAIVCLGAVRVWTASLMFCFSAALLANVFFIATARTTLVALPFMVMVLALRNFGWRGLMQAMVMLALLAGAAWASSDYLRERVRGVGDEISQYWHAQELTSSGLRLEFWRKSLRFVREAPFLGHGTGSIPRLYRESAIGQSGAAAAGATNPHNQVFGVVIQLGLIGGALLFAMWGAHLRLFACQGPIATIGLVLVVQHIVSCMFNSHLFDFSQGWTYVFGVGMLGALVRSSPTRSGAPEIGAPADLAETGGRRD